MGMCGMLRLRPMWAAVVLLLPASLFPLITYLPGWPQDVTDYYSSPICFADVDDDGQNELAFSDSQDLVGSPLLSRLYVCQHNGTIETGWPKERGGGGTAPLLTDINDDGKLEIFSTYSGVHMYRFDGSLIWEHWYDGSIFQSTYLPHQVSVDDLDNDGTKELVVTCYWGGAVFVFDAQGNVRPGWPVLLTRPAGWSPPPIYGSSQGSVHDLGF
jgi:hypothetical protein